MNTFFKVVMYQSKILLHNEYRRYRCGLVKTHSTGQYMAFLYKKVQERSKTDLTD